MHWTFDYPWGATATWLAVVGVAMVLAASFAMVWRELLPLSAASAAVVALRLAALVLLVYLLIQPSVNFKRTREVKPHVAVLLDTSGSMDVVDRGHSRKRVREAIETLGRARLLERLGEKAQPHLFEFSTGISRLKQQKLHELKEATGTGTSLGLALSQTAEEFRGQDLAAAIVLSDGRDNTGTDPLKAAAELNVPIYTIGFGRPRPKEEKARDRDLMIVQVSHDRRVVVGHTTDLTVTVASKGYEARSVPVELVLDGEVVAASAVALSPDRPERQVTMKLKPTSPGQYVYSVRVPPDAGERDKSNNEKPVPVFVTDPVWRVLYVEARPRWEFKFLSRVLAAYKNIEYTAIVPTAPEEVKIAGTNPADAARIAAMTPDQLRRLKAIIIGDVPRTFFSPEQLATIAALVEQGGSVLLMAGKSSFGLEGFGRTALERVLPVYLHKTASYMERRFRVRLTNEGKAHPAFQEMEHDWSRAPELISMVGIAGLKPGATVLMETTDGESLPVVVVHRYGHGKAAVVLTDCTWRWRLGLADGTIDVDLQTIFWRRLITWLMPEEKAEKEKRAVQLVADKLHYELNEQATLTVTATDAEGKAVRNAKVVCRVYAPDGKTIERQAALTRIGGGEGAEAYVATFTPYTGGKYRVVATARQDGVDLGRDQLALVVGDTSIEKKETDPDRDLLKRLATSTNGRYYDSLEGERVADDLELVPKKHTWRKTQEVWDRWWVFLALLGLVGAEWTIRRMRQLE